MASIIKIKRSGTAGNPSVLALGELAYSSLPNDNTNGGDRLYIGTGTDDGSGNASNHTVIGGKYYTSLVDAGGTGGTLNTAAKSVPVLSATGTIDKWLVGNLQLVTNTLSSTNTNGDINLTPNGTGKTIITNPYIGDNLTSLAEYIYDTVGGAVTAGTGISITNSDGANTSTVAIANTAVAAGTYGSSTQIPSFTVNAQGQLTAAANNAITVGSAGLTLQIGTAGASNTTVTVGTGTGFNANSTVASTYDIKVGPALTNLASLMTSGSTGFIKRTGADTYSIDTNTYLTASTGVTTFSGGTTGLTPAAATSGAITLAGTLAVANGGTGTTTGSITGTGALTFTAGGANNNVNLAPTGTGTVDVGGKRITSVAEPTQATDAATKNYVDAVKTGLDIKDSVRVATTGALSVTYSNGAAGVGATITNANTQAALTIDSIPLAVNDRVLIKDQASALQNGIYVVTDIGSASTNWVLTRSGDADNSPTTELSPGVFTFVEEGTTNANNGFVCTTAGAITVGTTAITWVQFSGAGSFNAGNGLTKTGSTLDVVGTANRISVLADSVDIASTYVGQTSITTLGTIGTGTWQGTLISPTYGGTGVNNGTKTITLGGNLTTSGAFATTLTVTAATSVTLPTAGTLATLAGSETFTNKTLTSPTINGGALSGTFSGNHAVSGVATFSNTTDATSTVAAGVVMSGGLGIAKSMYVGVNITGSGATTSAIDGFTLDGGTY